MVSILVPSLDAAPRQDSAGAAGAPPTLPRAVGFRRRGDERPAGPVGLSRGAVEPSGRNPGLAEPSIGNLLYLGSVGLVASGIVAVFFGTGLSLLAPTAGGTPSRSAAKPGPEVIFLQPPSARNDDPAPSTGSTDAVRSFASLPPAQERQLMPGDDVSPPQGPADTAGAPAPENRPATVAAAAVPAPSATAATPLGQPTSVLSAAEVSELLQHGDSLLRIGDVASARLFYERAAAAGDGRAALRLGATFDPAFVERLGLGKLQANAPEARSWYSRALDLGVIGAKHQLNGLETRQGK
jgi:hypothetical protein